MTKTEYFLEILNGGAVTPEAIGLGILGIYLIKEARRAHLRWWQWFHLPTNMSFVLAVFIFDSGVLLKSLVIWWWRYLGAGSFSMIETAGLCASGLLIVFGALCKIRALTVPNHGGRPWVQSLAVTVGAIVLLLLL